MCGIAGIFHYQEPSRPVDRAVLEAMTRSLAHRGPDGEGLWVGAGIGLGHRRLAILDLSDNASQPMVDPTGTCVITYNGEIYNFRDLRRELEAEGHRFRSTSDTEVILAGYRQWGSKVIDRLSGIFAFAIWDGQRRTLLLARDPIGVKPLFYCLDGGTLRFGSEIKAILTDPSVGREPDLAGLDAFFTFSYTPAPATGFKRVRQLLPGHGASVDERGLRTWPCWTTPYAEQPTEVNFATAVEEFTERLDRVTRAQMVSDVPVGGFLSGGLDSAAIIRAMQRAAPGAVHALTVGFDLPGYDERPAARQTAGRLGISLDEQEVSVDATSLLATLSQHAEEPTADSSMLPVYLLCKAARERFTVAMSGDGADEILAGYDTYRATALARYYRWIPRALRLKLIQPLARALPIGEGKYCLHQVANRFTRGAELGPLRDHCAWRVMFNHPLKRRLYAEGFRREVCGQEPLDAYARHIGAVPPGREQLAGLLNADTEFYLPNDMLVKVDRMSMACGLEVRVPFLDIDMVRYCANLPGDFKLHRGRIRKHILRESLRRSVPDEVLDRPKSGFNVPVEQWMRGSLRALLFDALATHRHAVSEFLDVPQVERIAQEHLNKQADHGHALFTIMMFALWLDNKAHAWKRVKPAPTLTACR